MPSIVTVDKAMTLLPYLQGNGTVRGKAPWLSFTHSSPDHFVHLATARGAQHDGHAATRLPLINPIHAEDSVQFCYETHTSFAAHDQQAIPHRCTWPDCSK
jgi:hypothetical protein